VVAIHRQAAAIERPKGPFLSLMPFMV